MNIFLALAPSILLIILLNLVGLPVYIASFVAILAAYILFWNRLHAKVATAQRGAVQAITSACTVALVVGFGSVVASTSGYQVILDALAMIPDSLGYFQVIIAVNLAAGSNRLLQRRTEYRAGFPERPFPQRPESEPGSGPPNRLY